MNPPLVPHFPHPGRDIDSYLQFRSKCRIVASSLTVRRLTSPAATYRLLVAVPVTGPPGRGIRHVADTTHQKYHKVLFSLYRHLMGINCADRLPRQFRVVPLALVCGAIHTVHPSADRATPRHTGFRGCNPIPVFGMTCYPRKNSTCGCWSAEGDGRAIGPVAP